MTKDTGKARLPGLAAPSIDSPDLARWVQAVSERLEVREGARGNPYERALTVRDLVGTGLATMGAGGGLSRAGGSGSESNPYAPVVDEGYEKLWDELRNSRIYRSLLQRIDDPDRFNHLAEEIKAVLLNNIADEARRRQADVQRVDTKLQTETRSLAMAVQEVTASVEDAHAGVRSVQFAQATPDTALAAQVTQIVARLDGEAIAPADIVTPVRNSLSDLIAAVPVGENGKFYQVKNPVAGAPAILYRWDAARAKYVLAGMANSAAIEQVMQATADRVAGLSSEYYVKLQAGGAFGGYGLSAHEKDGVGYSQFLIAADKFAMTSPDGTINPFLVAQQGGTGPYYLYLNGQVRINTGAGGAGTLEELADRMEVRADRQAFKQSAAGVWDAAQATLSAFVTGTLVGRTVTWQVVSGSYTGATGAGLSLTVNRADMTTATVTFRASVTSPAGAVRTDQITLVRLSDGAAGAAGPKGDQGSVGATGSAGATGSTGAAGQDALAGYLTNEAHTVAADGAGNVLPAAMAAAAGQFKVFRGATDVTGACTFATPSTSGLTASIAATGNYAASAYTGSSDTATATFSATYAGATITKVFTVTRAREGKRGTVSGYSSTTSSWMAGASWAANTAQNDYLASLVVWHLVYANTSLPVSTHRDHLRIGDTVTLQSSDGTKAETRYWGGSGWVAPGVIIDGNLLVKGSISSDKINTYSLTSDWAFINNLTVHAANIMGTIQAHQMVAQEVRADMIVEGTNTRHSGYKFGFGAGVDVFGLRGAGYFRSEVYNTYGLCVSHSAGNAAIVGHATLTGVGALLSVGENINGPDFAVTLCKNSLAGFFQYRINGGPSASQDSHINGAQSSAALGRVSSAGDFQRGSVTTALCGSDPAYGVDSNAGVRGAGLTATSNGVTSAASGVTAELCRYNRGTTQGLWTSGGAYIEQYVIIGMGLRVNGTVSAVNYINFTGVHMAVVADAEAPAFEIGDLCADVEVVMRKGVSDAVTRVTRSSLAGQRGVSGIYSAPSEGAIPHAFAQPDPNPNSSGEFLTPEAAHLLLTHTLIAINAVGEGQVNVCGRGGNLAIGDLLEASSMPGKAQRQADDIVRSSTVGKVREQVAFTDPDEVRMVACIYMCG